MDTRNKYFGYLFFKLLKIGLFCKKAKKDMLKIVNTNQHEKLYKLMEFFDKLCLKFNIKYFINGGTLLGAVRHGHIIPWDDDIDISMFEEDIQKLQSTEVSTYITKHNYKLLNGWVLKFVEVGDEAKNNGLNAWIDIFKMRINGDKVEYFESNHLKRWPTEWFYENEIKPYKRYKFGNLEVFGPNKNNPFTR